jgi:ectoine hydroxylase-related dioxygenase (phytanoyl-CoA dioxygenase family)
VLARKRRLRTRLPIELHRRSPFLLLLRAVDRSAQVLPAPAVPRRWVASESWIRSAPPGGRAQRVHRDRHVLAGDGAAWDARPRFSLDVLLTDFTEENGATEVWPGSHRIVDRDAVEASRAEERAALRPSVRIAASAGSIVARDLGAWHRATANRTSTPRLMLSVTFAAL